jgi:hypothetical protein
VYIVAIAWLYVAILMASTEPGFVAGLMTFFFYGLGPLLLFWWIVGYPKRRHRKLMRMRMGEVADRPDDKNPGGDQ